MEYKEAIVYRIIHLHSNIQYVGSTYQKRISQRWQDHKSSYVKWVDGKFRSASVIYEYFKKYGIENFKIIEIKKYKVCYDIEIYKTTGIHDRRHLNMYEGLWINKLKSINKNNPSCMHKNKFISSPYHRTYHIENRDKILTYHKKWYENNKEIVAVKGKEYRENNKEVIAVRNKEYRENNKEKIAVKSKEYQKNNKENIKTYKKEYYEKNKEKIAVKNKETIICECGIKITKGKINRHLKSKRHEQLLNGSYKTPKKYEKVICECGAEVVKPALWKHKQSKKHKDIINRCV